MIGRVLKRGSRVSGLVWYLYGPGRACEHVSPHLVSGWRHPAELEPPLRPDGRRDFRMLNDLLMQPVTALGDRAPALPVWHCVVRAAPGDPDLGDGAWMRIAGEIMHRTGLSRRGDEDNAVRWIAVHHGGNHIHIVATLARQDGRRARLSNDYYRIGEALRDIEAEYGLQAVARADRTADRRPTRAEMEKAARAGRPEPARATLRRAAAQAAAAARSEAEFFAALARAGLQVRLRHSTREPGEVTGYAVSLPGDQTAAGAPVWFGGGQLAADLTLPKLRRRWPDPADRAPSGPGRLPGLDPGRAARLHGHGMTSAAARAALRREVARAAAAARTPPQFFAALAQAGLLTRIRYHPARPGQAAGYAVSLPGLLHHRDGQQVWYGGQALDPGLTLPALRRRWQAGQPGTPPSAAFDGASTRDIFGYATASAAAAATRIRAGSGPGPADDIAWATADMLTAAAATSGSPQLRAAADSFARAARVPWGRTPLPSPTGAGLRTAAYLLAACQPSGYRRSAALTLITALARLADAIAGLRQAQARQAQAAAARMAAAQFAAAASPAAAARAAAANFPIPLAGAHLTIPQTGPGRARPGPTAPAPGPRRAR